MWIALSNENAYSSHKQSSTIKTENRSIVEPAGAQL